MLKAFDLLGVRRIEYIMWGVYRDYIGILFPPSPLTTSIKDFKFVPSMFVILGFGSQIPLLKAVFHGLGTQAQRYKLQGYKGQLPVSIVPLK